MQIFGFTMLRNGEKYDYPYRETLQSLKPIVQKTVIALGRGEDATASVVEQMEGVEIIPTVWDQSLREGAIILSQQTNVALEHLKKTVNSLAQSWGLYLQCDEVIHQEDYPIIQQDLQLALQQGCDAVSFRYLHFWKDHHHLAINKKWYPHEIRAVRLDSHCESWGDAQSFRHYKKIFYSNAHIYHYGHVRENKSYQEKKRDILKLYYEEKKLAKYTFRERRLDAQTETLSYLGTHPFVMRERILRLGDRWDFPESEEVNVVVEDESIFSNDLWSKIAAQKLRVAKDLPHLRRLLGKAKKIQRENTIIFTPQWWQKIFYPTRVPLSMRSKLSHPWGADFLLILKLSEKGIALRS